MRKPLFVLALILVMGAVTAGLAMFNPGLLRARGPAALGTQFAGGSFIEPSGWLLAQAPYIEPAGFWFAHAPYIEPLGVRLAQAPFIEPIGARLV